MRSQKGATLVEYALLLLLIVMVAVVGVTAFGNKLGGKYNLINTELSALPGG